MLRYEVPFVIWTNYESEAEDVGVVSLNFLSSLVYRAAGMELPAYNRFLEDVRAEIPAMNALGYFSRQSGGFVPYSSAKGGEAEILADYFAVEYNGMFDGKNRSTVFFPGE